jgi:hypothetical protein
MGDPCRRGTLVRKQATASLQRKGARIPQGRSVCDRCHVEHRLFYRRVSEPVIDLPGVAFKPAQLSGAAAAAQQVSLSAAQMHFCIASPLGGQISRSVDILTSLMPMSISSTGLLADSPSCEPNLVWLLLTPPPDIEAP